MTIHSTFSLAKLQIAAPNILILPSIVCDAKEKAKGVRTEGGSPEDYPAESDGNRRKENALGKPRTKKLPST
jgi:hypothetical protein